MADTTANIRIKVDDTELKKAERAFKNFKDEVESGKSALDGMDFKDTSEGLDEFATKSGNASKALGGMAQGASGAVASVSKLAGPVGIAVGAVVGLATAVYGAASAFKDAAREINEGLLDAIEDVSFGSEEATEKFDRVEEAMRGIRGQTELLRRGYSNVEEAMAGATEEFIKNEAAVRALNQIMPDLKQLSVDAGRAIIRQLVPALYEEAEAHAAAELATLSHMNAIERMTEVLGDEVAPGLDQMLEALGEIGGSGYQDVFRSLWYELQKVSASIPSQDIEEFKNTIRRTLRTMAESDDDVRPLIRSFESLLFITDENNVVLQRMMSTLKSLGLVTEDSTASVEDNTSSLRTNNRVREESVRILTKQEEMLKAQARAEIEALRAQEAQELERQQQRIEKEREREAMAEELRLISMQKEYDAFVAHGERLKELARNNQDKISEIEAEQFRVREENISSATSSLSAILLAATEKDAKARKKALKKAFGQEMILYGTKLVAMGVADLAAQNYAKGAGELAGGIGLQIAGAKMAGGGGGGGGGPRGQQAPAQAPAPVQNITFNQSTSFGFVGDRRSATREIEDINRRSIDRGFSNIGQTT